MKDIREQLKKEITNIVYNKFIEIREKSVPKIKKRLLELTKEKPKYTKNQKKASLSISKTLGTPEPDKPLIPPELKDKNIDAIINAGVVGTEIIVKSEGIETHVIFSKDVNKIIQSQSEENQKSLKNDIIKIIKDNT